MARAYWSSLFHSQVFNTELESDQEMSVWFHDDEIARVIYWIYLQGHRLDKPVQVASNKQSPASLLHLATEVFRVTEFSKEWAQARAKATVNGQVDHAKQALHQNVSLRFLLMKEDQIRVVAGLPAVDPGPGYRYCSPIHMHWP